MLNIFRKPTQKKFSNTSTKKQGEQEAQDKADIDLIIEEYLNLNQIT